MFTSAVYSQQMDENGVYLQAEKMPVIKGGMREIGRKIQYPRIAKEMGIQGVVYVGFVVNENGQVVDAVVTNTGIGYDSNTTEVRAFSRGSNGAYAARVRSLTLNNTHRFGDSFLSTKFWDAKLLKVNYRV